MKIINSIKNSLLPGETKNEEEEKFQEVLSNTFPEAEEIVKQQEPQQSAFEQCLSEIKQLIESGNTEKLAEKLSELDFITQTYDKKIKNYKEIIKRQTEFYKDKNKYIVEKSKRKTVQLKEKDQLIKELKEGLSIYKQLELKYAKALKEIESQQQIIEYNRNQLRKK